MAKADVWFIYMLRCADNSLYTGITTNVERRVQEHNGLKTGAKYTKSRRPVTLVYREQCDNKSQALIREYEIKQLSKKLKEKLTNDTI